VYSVFFCSASLCSLCMLRCFVLVFLGNKVQNRQKKNTVECFTTKLKSTCKNSGTFEEKKISPKKFSYVSLAPSHSIVDKEWLLGKCFTCTEWLAIERMDIEWFSDCPVSSILKTLPGCQVSRHKIFYICLL